MIRIFFWLPRGRNVGLSSLQVGDPSDGNATYISWWPKNPLNIYKKACAEHGHAPDIVYIRPVYLDDDEKVIRREVEQALLNFLAFNASPVDSLQDEEKKKALRAKGYGFYARDRKSVV